MLDNVVSIRQEPYEWKLFHHGNGVAFQAIDRNMYMAADPGVGSGVYIRESLRGWEEWKIEDGIVQSAHGTNLSAGAEGVVLVNDRSRNEIITIEEKLSKDDDPFILGPMATSGTSRFRIQDGVVTLKMNEDLHRDDLFGLPETAWLMKRRKGSKKVLLQYVSRGYKYNMYLSADPGHWAGVFVRHTMKGWEEWYPRYRKHPGSPDLHLFDMQSFHGTYLSVDSKDKKVNLNPNSGHNELFFKYPPKVDDFDMVGGGRSWSWSWTCVGLSAVIMGMAVLQG